MSDLVTVYLFRHGETDWNRERRLQGSTDILLNEMGHAQALKLAQQLRSYGISAVVSSDLTRAQQTAAAVLSELHAHHAYKPILKLDSRLRETSLGDVEGKTVEEVQKDFGHHMIESWHSMDPTHADFRFPNGESKLEVRLRAMQAIEEFISEQPDARCIAVSSHGGVIRRVIQAVMPELPKAVMVPNCSVFELQYSRQHRKWNFVSSGLGSDLIEAARGQADV